MTRLRIATFEREIAPPVGHPLCGGGIRPVESVTDPLLALGVVLDWEEGRAVLCAVDWCELRNESHRQFRYALADAVGIESDHVAVQCVHQHNAPLFDHEAQRLVETQDGLPGLMDAWFEVAAANVAEAARSAMDRQEAVDGVSHGEARVEKVASNRRIIGADGILKTSRWSKCDDPAVRDEPEGLIDPMLKTISFWSGDRKRAALHYYATHPMSYYGDGVVSCDFYGLARNRRADEEGVTHLAFTGCAGNVTAGKYNDGSAPNREVLTRRMHAAMVASEAGAKPEPILTVAWKSGSLPLIPRERSEAALLATLDDASLSDYLRKMAAFKLSFLRQMEEEPIPVSCLHLNDLRILHLPGEPFVEYQLFAQRIAPVRFAATAGYGDGGAGYLPLERSFAEGGYEPTEAYAEPSSQALIEAAISDLLG